MKQQKQTKQRTVPGRMPGVDLPYVLTAGTSRIVMAVLVLLTLAAGFWYLQPMIGAAGVPGFPLDDAWIAQSFARTLHDVGRYAFAPDAPGISGSTSPLHVFVLAALRMVTADEFALAWIVGIASFLALALLMFALGRRLFAREQWVAVAAAVLLALLPRMHSEAVSGMPTLLYTALIVGAAAAYFARRPLPFFIAAGLALWVRPDALVFTIAALLHIGHHHGFVRRSELADGNAPAQAASPRQTAIGGGIFAALVATYALFNSGLGAGMFPNAVAAKLAWYGAAGDGFGAGVWAFYTRGAGAVLILFAVAELGFVAHRVLRREQAPLLMSALYVVGSIAAYWWLLPALPDGGRYLVPTLPFFLLLAVAGLRDSAAFLMSALPVSAMRPVANGLTMFILATAGIVALAGAGSARGDFTAAVRYVADRQVAAGKWINAHTAKTARVATHQPGAIGYYGRRRLTDITGVVSPQVVPALGDFAALTAILRGERIDYIATLREQFEVVNAAPVFTSDPLHSEVMEIVPTAGGHTHLMTPVASALNAEAVKALQYQQPEAAIRALRQSVQIDGSSSRTMSLLGLAMLGARDSASAVIAFREALRIFPDYAQAMTPLGDLLIARHEIREGVSLLRRASELNPSSFTVRQSLERALEVQRADSLESIGIHTYTLSR
jgi:hypothetical protein